MSSHLSSIILINSNFPSPFHHYYGSPFLHKSLVPLALHLSPSGFLITFLTYHIIALSAYAYLPITLQQLFEESSSPAFIGWLHLSSTCLFLKIPHPPPPPAAHHPSPFVGSPTGEHLITASLFIPPLVLKKGSSQNIVNSSSSSPPFLTNPYCHQTTEQSDRKQMLIFQPTSMQPLHFLCNYNIIMLSQILHLYFSLCITHCVSV